MSTFLCELSTPLVNLRGLLVVQKKEETIFFKVNDALVAILFVVFRILYFPIMLWRMVYGFKFLVVRSELGLT